MRRIVRVELEDALQVLTRARPLGGRGCLAARVELGKPLLGCEGEEIRQAARRRCCRERAQRRERGEAGGESTLQLGLPGGGGVVVVGGVVLPPPPPAPAPELLDVLVVGAVVAVPGGVAELIACVITLAETPASLAPFVTSEAGAPEVMAAVTTV